MRTRCPACSTIFRVTPEQLALRAGKVRCGQCHHIFNAQETLIAESTNAFTQEDHWPDDPPLPPSPSLITTLPNFPSSLDLASPPATPEPPSEPPASTPSASRNEPVFTPPAPAPTPQDSEPIISTDHGQIAARSLLETSHYNRWAASPLNSDTPFRLSEQDEEHRPFRIAAYVLALLLMLQAAYWLRGEITRQWPALYPAYDLIGLPPPLARDSALAHIEASDLQSDHERHLLVLHATLANRAPYPQAWPHLELTLTDLNDSPVLRKVLAPSDYLTPEQAARIFAARTEHPVRLWLRHDGQATGYRLFLFYP